MALGRELLADPSWTDRAALALGVADHRAWHPHAGWYLHQRQAELDRLAVAGHTPMTRYAGARPDVRPNDGQVMIESAVRPDPRRP